MSLPLVCKVSKQADCLIHASFIVLCTVLWSYFRAWIDVVNSPTMLSFRGFFSTTVRNRILCASEAQLLALLNTIIAQSILHFLFFIEFNCNHVKNYVHSLSHSFNKLLKNDCTPGTMLGTSPQESIQDCHIKKNNKKKKHTKSKMWPLLHTLKCHDIEACSGYYGAEEGRVSASRWWLHYMGVRSDEAFEERRSLFWVLNQAQRGKHSEGTDIKTQGYGRMPVT